MVKFVGGPSVGGYKSYINHTTAREGQWRMPRNYARPNVKVDIRNYNYCNHGAVNTGFQLPAWLQWAQFGLNLLGGLLPAQQQAPQQEVNPLQSQLDEMQKKIDDLEKENKELKNKPNEKPNEQNPATDPTDPKEPAAPTPETDKFSGEDDAQEETITTTNKDTVQVFNKARRLNATQNEGYTWKSLQDAYVAEDGSTVPNTTEFRNWFRKTHLGGATDIGVNEQHYPKEISYGGKTYKFDTNKYKPNIIETSGTYNGTSAHTTEKTTTETSKVYTGTAKVTWTDKDGKTTTKSTKTSEKYKTASEAKSAARAALQNQVPEQHRSNAFFQTNAKK